MSGLFEITGIPALTILGFLVGMLGTLVGAGGGFILVPILIFLLPQESADRITAISMAVVFCNALSGTIAYTWMRRVDFTSGWRFALAAIPGAVLGAVMTRFLSRQIFDRMMGGSLVIIAAYLLWRTFRPTAIPEHSAEMADGTFNLSIKDRKVGSILSSGVGFVSSALGIGGGIIHVPALIYVLGYPVHIATATSHFVLACTSLAAVAEHVIYQSYQGNIVKTVVMSLGAIIGAQAGARLSLRIKGPAIVGVLAVAQLFVGLRILLRTF